MHSVHKGIFCRVAVAEGTICKWRTNVAAEEIHSRLMNAQLVWALCPSVQRSGSRVGCCCVSWSWGEVGGWGFERVWLWTNGSTAASAKGHTGWPHTFSPSPKARGEVFHNKTHDSLSQLNSEKPQSNFTFFQPAGCFFFPSPCYQMNCRSGFYFTATTFTFVCTLRNEKMYKSLPVALI